MINSFLKIYLFVYAFVELLIYTVQVVLEPLWRPLTVIRKKVLIHSLNSCMAPSFSTLSFPPFLFLISAFTCFQTFLRNISTIFEQVCIKEFVLYHLRFFCFHLSRTPYLHVASGFRTTVNKNICIESVDPQPDL